MTAGGDQDPIRTTLSATTIDLAIRLGFIGLLGYWLFRVITPFVTIGLWSGILAVALYPLFDWLAARLSPRLAAAVVTLLCVVVVVGPVTWLGFGMVSGTRSLVAALDAGQLALPVPPESVKGWPVVGERFHQLWSLAATNTKAALAKHCRCSSRLAVRSWALLRTHCSPCLSSLSRSSSRGSCSFGGDEWSMG